jgi:hypothetical protein
MACKRSAVRSRVAPPKKSIAYILEPAHHRVRGYAWECACKCYRAETRTAMGSEILPLFPPLQGWEPISATHSGVNDYWRVVIAKHLTIGIRLRCARRQAITGKGIISPAAQHSFNPRVLASTADSPLVVAKRATSAR